MSAGEVEDFASQAAGASKLTAEVSEKEYRGLTGRYGSHRFAAEALKISLERRPGGWQMVDKISAESSQQAVAITRDSKECKS